MSTNSMLSDRATRWVFLSPHLDDAVYSCGGLIAYLSAKKINVEIWTVFSEQESDESRLTEYARSLHLRWAAGNQPYTARKKEDTNACKKVGAGMVHLGFLDCIYRYLPGNSNPVVLSDSALFGNVNPEEEPLIRNIRGLFQEKLVEPSIWVCPLGLGHHIDHQITRMAAEGINRMMLYYADLPYALTMPVQVIPGMIQLCFDLPEESVLTWGRANLQYASQISSFWKDAGEMASQYSSYLEQYHGMPLYLPKSAGGKE